jgi:hypothetical protein
MQFLPTLVTAIKTVFANIYEHQHNNASFNNLEKAQQITLTIAEFSYAAEILPDHPGSHRHLEILPQYKKRQLEDRYKISDQFAISSDFEFNSKRVDNYPVVPSTDLHQTIVEKIKEVQDNRLILIFFNNRRELS